MFVKNYMQKAPVTICGESTLPEAVEFLHNHGLLTLPVMDGNKVIGVVTDRDVVKAGSSSASLLHRYDLEYLMPKIKVSDIMSRMVVSVSPDMIMEEAAKILHDRKISGVPVMEDGELVGLLTINEVLEFFGSLFEHEEESYNFALKLDNEAESLAQAIQIVMSHGAVITSLVTAPAGKGKHGKELMLSLDCKDSDSIMQDFLSSDLLVNAN